MGKKPVIRAGQGCVARLLLVVPREAIVLCVLHMVIAFGRLLHSYIQSITAEVGSKL